MKRIILLCIIVCTASAGFAQTDTTANNENTTDTIKIGGMIIIRKPGSQDKEAKQERNVQIMNRKRNNNSNVSTNWWIVDLGFNNIADNSNYATALSSGYLQPGNSQHSFTDNDFKLRAGKSVNVNVWVFMQKLNMIKHVVNLKYGLGVELNNYRYKKDNNISYRDASPSYIFWDSVSFSKNKLAADYVTVPMMLNFNTTPRSGNRGFSFSVGVSAGYLYSGRNKQISDERGKKKEKGDIGLEKWKLAYIGELGLGPVRLYGSYAITNMFEKGLDQKPYSIGIRLSNW